MFCRKKELTIMPATQYLKLTEPLRFRKGGLLNEYQLAYETWGVLNSAKSNAILLFTGLSPSAHAASSPQDQSPGWWEDMIGSECPLDSDKYFIICVNSLGSCYGSTGPASINPDSGQRFALDFPVLTLEDIALTTDKVVKYFEIKRLNTVIGASMGGMSALAYLLQFPDKTRNFISISSALRAEPFAIALRSLQRELIRSDDVWAGGDYADNEQPVSGMQLARKLGMITYRSAQEWRKRFGRERASERGGGAFGIEFDVESYLEAHAKKFTGQFDANCYLYLSRALDLFDAAEHGGSVHAALKSVNIEKALVLGVKSDFLFPVHQQQEVADALSEVCDSVHFEELSSIQGHDSFLVDMDSFRPVICDFLTGS
jgi:homoserine O-acetyltransferase